MAPGAQKCTKYILVATTTMQRRDMQNLFSLPQTQKKYKKTLGHALNNRMGSHYAQQLHFGSNVVTRARPDPKKSPAGALPNSRECSDDNTTTTRNTRREQGSSHKTQINGNQKTKNLDPSCRGFSHFETNVGPLFRQHMLISIGEDGWTKCVDESLSKLDTD